MQWFLSDDLPATSNQYLVSSNGVLIFADYSSVKKRWTCGDGMDREEILIDAWAQKPTPIIYMTREIGEGDWEACSKEWFDRCQDSALIDTKIIEF